MVLLEREGIKDDRKVEGVGSKREKRSQKQGMKDGVTHSVEVWRGSLSVCVFVCVRGN